MKFFTIFILWLFVIVSHAQNIESGITEVGKCIVENGRYFLNTPYAPGTLDKNDEEKLVCYSNQFDCVTFIEYILALSIYQLNTQASNPKTFENILTSLRYRHGQIDGYTSRIHYFTEWIDQQQKNGCIDNITKKIGGIRDNRTINFMSNHLNKYPRLKSEDDIQQILTTEKSINEMIRYYIPKDKVKDIDLYIKSGDIIAITTSIKGLDISHTGIAIRKENDVYLLHASEKEKKVIISDLTLHQYLKSNATQSGILVLRPK
jgi:hypothetical protein